MKHEEAREEMRALAEGRLSAARAGEVRAHLAECAECRAVEEADRAMTDVLRTQLPRYGAPASLKARLAAMAEAHAEAEAEPHAKPDAHREANARADVHPFPTRAQRDARRTGALAILVAIAACFALFMVRKPHAPDASPLVTESVNDHLRTLYAEHPIEIASGGIHQVKPWFTGRLDFAPAVAFSGDDDFPLEGGAVAYFVDRKAAAFFFKRRLHAISLFVFRADGLDVPLGLTDATFHGFHVVLWRKGELGYALVSDVDRAELATLAAKITP